MQLIRVGLLWTTTLFAAAAVAQPTAEELTATLRESLEGQFRDATGLGFTSFECDIEIADSPPQELTCQAVDEEGDQFFYRLVSQAGDQPVKVTTSQPVSQLNPAALEVLVAPCVEFLDAFGRSDWPTAHASLSPELQEVFALVNSGHRSDRSGSPRRGERGQATPFHAFSRCAFARVRSGFAGRRCSGAIPAAIRRG